MRRLTAFALALGLLLAPAAAGAAGTVGTRPGAGSHRATDAPATTFTGFDGHTYESSPPAIEASDGTYFYGGDFDLGCAYEPLYRPALERLDRLANLIRLSGRAVQYTVAPNKSSVDTQALSTVTLPHGSCDAEAISAGIRLLDRWDAPSYIPIRRQLHRVAATTPTYWKVDTHWNTVGAVTFTRRLAARLDPALAHRQRYASGEETYPDDLYRLGYADQQYDVGPSLTPTTRVRVEPTHGSPAYDSTGANASLSWRSRPASRVWNGATLLAGDSFFFRGLASLMPLFRNGRFVLVDPTASEQLAAAIASSRTVVLEVVQRYLPFSLLTSSVFYKQVRHALRQADAAR